MILIEALTFISAALAAYVAADTFLPRITTRKIGGIHFARVGRYQVSICRPRV